MKLNTVALRKGVTSRSRDIGNPSMRDRGRVPVNSRPLSARRSAEVLYKELSGGKTMEYVWRFAIGGVAVSLFAIMGDVLRRRVL
jgi:hypothetical protein